MKTKNPANNWSDDKCEYLLTKSGLDQNLTKIEPRLYGSKWFDYRFRHHVWATSEFASVYQDVTRATHRTCFDKHEARDIKIIKTNVMQLPKVNLTSY